MEQSGAQHEGREKLEDEEKWSKTRAIKTMRLDGRG